ncbi:MAG: translocation/assembly module TamB domain-containing protein [Acidovorax sp.]
MNPPAPRPRTARTLAWLAATLLALALAAAGGAWWWAGQADSLAAVLARAAHYLPAGQTLESRDVNGSLRAGGRIGWLRWSSPTLAVEVEDARLGWSLRPLLSRTLRLSEVSAARVQLTPQTPPTPEPEKPTQPLTGLELPLHIDLPAVRVGQITWAAPSAPITLNDLQASYRYDGVGHHLDLTQLRFDQGRYHAQATLQGAAPMRLDATLGAAVQTPVPGGDQPLAVTAQAKVQGTLATADARLNVTAKADGDNGMYAQLQATLAPWLPQPVVDAQADLAGLNLAALWPQLPVTQLSGHLQAAPQNKTWALQTQLANAQPGPWDKARLPLSALDADVQFDGQQWQVAHATARLHDSSVAVQGRFEPASGLFDGTATVSNLRPGDAYSTLDRAPVSGRATAQREGDAVRFTADLRAAAAPATKALRIDRIATEGRWQAGLLQLRNLQIQALQAQAESRQLQVHINDRAFDGDLRLALPGAKANLQGQLAARAGAGGLHVALADPQRTRAWLASLPGVQLPEGSAQGQANLDARWSGGWQALQAQLQRAGLVAGQPEAPGPFTLKASLTAPRLSLKQGAQDLQLQDLRATVEGSPASATAAVDGQAKSGTRYITLHARAQGGSTAAGQWNLHLGELRAQASDTTRPGPWTLQLDQPLTVTARQERGGLSVQASASQATVSGPAPGQATLRWQAVQWSPGKLQTRGELRGLPLAWANALDNIQPPLLERQGVGGNLVFDGEWDITAADTVRATASLRRASGDLRVLAGESTGPTTLHSSGNAATQRTVETAPGTPAGVREAQVQISLTGNDLRAALRWDSERAGRIQADASSRLAIPSGRWTEAAWPADAPVAATLKAALPDLGLWAAFAPPGWRVKGTFDADAQLSGTRADPRWRGHIAADQMALRSLIDGVDLKDGRLRATLDGTRLSVTEFRLKGGQGPATRILGKSGNRTQAPKDGGQLTATGNVTWTPGANSPLSMDFRAEAQKLQVQVRPDRQISLSGQLQARLTDGQFTLRGKLATDRATILLPDSSAPRLGDDVVVHSAAKDKEAAQKKAQEQAQAARDEKPTVQAAKPPDVQIQLSLGNDFALQGQGITTRLTGDLEIQSQGGTPRVTGEVRTDAGSYRAWGQALDVENGQILFTGPYDNPTLDILAIRPNISQRAGVQVTGTAKSPRVRLYSDPDLPDAEKLAWVVLGRSAASGGGEAALLQQAALAFMGGKGGAGGGIAGKVGLDEIGFKGPGNSSDDSSASGAALTFGKRLSSALYVTYEHGLSGTLGTLYLFYDLSRNLTLRGQTGLVNALDLVYTVRYD